MRFVDADTLKSGLTLSCDLCIIGAGAAGITLACELDGTPLDVIVLESGKPKTDESIQDLNDFDSSGFPMRRDQPSRYRALGGTTTIWTGKCVPLQPIDFERRDWIPHSGWPMTRQKLDPYYRRAVPYFKLPSDGLFSADGASEAVGLRERQFNDPELLMEPAAWAPTPENFASRRARLAKSHNVRVFTSATSVGLDKVVNRPSYVDRVRVVSLHGRKLTIAARVFVLACGGIENARQLLISRLGNEHDTVGRFLMDHPKTRGATCGRLYPDAQNFDRRMLLSTDIRGGSVRCNICLSPDFQRQHQLHNPAVLFLPHYADTDTTAFASYCAVGEAVRGRPGARLRVRDCVGVATGAWQLRGHVARRLTRRPPRVSGYFLENHLEQVPDPRSRITLSARVDRFGLPLPNINLHFDQASIRSLGALHTAIARNVAAGDMGRFESPLPDNPAFEPKFIDASHPMGSTRMSDDPKFGPVNCDGRLHAIDNVFVAGSSVFPTGGHANPTLTIVALAIRLADHLKRTLSPQEDELHHAPSPISNEVTKKLRVLVIGAGGRVNETVMPALRCLSDRVDVLGAYCRSEGSRRSFADRWGLPFIHDYRALRNQVLDLIILCVPGSKVPAVIRDLEAADLRLDQKTLAIDTPVLAPRDFDSLKRFASFKKVVALEDYVAFPPYVIARRLIREGRVGRIHALHLMHCGFMYHALATARWFADSAYPTRSRHVRFGAGAAETTYTFANRYVAKVVEPRDYARGRFLLVGSGGIISDYGAGAGNANAYDVRAVFNDGRFGGMTINGELQPHRASDRAMIDRLPYEMLTDRTPVNLLKIRALIDMFAAFAEGSDALNYSYEQALYDHCLDMINRKFGRFVDPMAPRRTCLRPLLFQMLPKLLTMRRGRA